MKYEFVDAKGAPAPPPKKRNTAREAERIVTQLSQGKVAQIEPDEGQTLRGMHVWLSRAANAAGKKTQTWEADGMLYVKLLDESADL